jgi:hypothetical protein
MVRGTDGGVRGPSFPGATRQEASTIVPAPSLRELRPMPSTLSSMQELLTGDLAVAGNWVVGNLDLGIPWPTKLVKVTFRNRTLLLLPPTSTPLPEEVALSSNETYPAIAIKLDTGEQFDEGMLIISHFLSSLVWVERRGARVEHWSGGNLPKPMGGRPRHPTYSEGFYRPYLPDTTEQRARWALAFYREGLSLKSRRVPMSKLFQDSEYLFANRFRAKKVDKCTYRARIRR